MSEADLESLVDRHYRRIHQAALVMTGNVWEADDLAQETFLQAMRALDRFGGHSRIETWLYAILVNQHRRRLRSQQRRRRRLLRWLEWAWTPPAAEPPELSVELPQAAQWRVIPLEIPQDGQQPDAQTLQKVLERLGQQLKQVDPPSQSPKASPVVPPTPAKPDGLTPLTVYVQRTETDRRLDQLTNEVKSLRQEVKKLTEQLRVISDRLPRDGGERK